MSVGVSALTATSRALIKESEGGVHEEEARGLPTPVRARRLRRLRAADPSQIAPLRGAQGGVKKALGMDGQLRDGPYVVAP